MRRLRPSGRRAKSRLRLVSLAILAVVALGGVTYATASLAGGDSTPPAMVTFGLPAAPTTGSHRNIVFVLTDDLSMNLLPYMPQVRAMMNSGMTFTNYTVSNSLCCPSRTSIFTGEFPHNSGVQSNDAPYGGYAGFQLHGDDTHTFATALRARGYYTGFFGKYLNGYAPLTDPTVPLGWSTWGGVDEGGYVGNDYYLDLNGEVGYHGSSAAEYLTSVLDPLARQFIGDSAAARRPFLLEVATFTPHNPYVPAPADRGVIPTLRVPRTPDFNRHPRDAPRWLASRPLLTKAQLAVDDDDYRLRAECVLSIDRLIGHLRAELVATGQYDNTDFVFSSDNGLHISEYGLSPGKLTAFDTDVNVPLVVTGPGIAPGSVDRRPVENIDLAPTFEQLAGAPIPSRVDGRSLVPLLLGKHIPWRTLSGIEHGSTETGPDDPDHQPKTAGELPIYKAIRSTTFTYVEYYDGEREYYDRARDPYMMDNVYDTLSSAQQAKLHSEVEALYTCKGYAQCWAAGVPSG